MQRKDVETCRSGPEDRQGTKGSQPGPDHLFPKPESHKRPLRQQQQGLHLFPARPGRLGEQTDEGTGVCRPAVAAWGSD